MSSSRLEADGDSRAHSHGDSGVNGALGAGLHKLPAGGLLFVALVVSCSGETPPGAESPVPVEATNAAPTSNVASVPSAVASPSGASSSADGTSRISTSGVGATQPAEDSSGTSPSHSSETHASETDPRAVTSNHTFAETETSVADSSGATSGPPPLNAGETLAFPGAEGFGRLAKGGRGGDVYHVTTLADSGPGSLRDAISQPNRTVVFDVSGVIRIEERLVFKSNQTIAGQTAPGGGVTIYGNGTSFSGASNTVVRFVRFRMGKVGESGKDTVAVASGHDLIWDHCSLSWGRDGTFDLNQESGKELYNLTLQDSIVAQGLQTHSTGGLVVTQGTSILRSLYIDNNSRNPKARGTLQFVNNVIYNWVVSAYILGDTSGRSDGYMRGNYFITGPETKGGTLDSPTPEYHVFALDNWYDSNKDGVLNGRELGQGDFGTATWEVSPSVQYPTVTELPAEEALRYVRSNAGASLWRDAVDDYVMAELDSFGTTGATISDETSLGISETVGQIPSGQAPADTDGDGMPDAWESEHGFNPASADGNGDVDGDGYTNLEDYLNSLVPAPR